MNSDVNALISGQDSLGQVATKIGHSLWWTLPKTSIDHAELERQAKICGVPDEYLPDEVTFISAFRRAVASLKTPLEKQKLLLRELSDDKRAWKLAIISETMEIRGQRLQHEQIGIIEADKNGSFIVTPETSYSASILESVESVKRQLMSAFNECLKHNTDDIRRVITNFTADCGISLRDSGGIYFIPIAHESTLRAIARLVSNVSPSATMYIKPEYILEDSDLEALRMVASSELASEIAKLEESFASMQSDMDEMISSKSRPNRKKSQQLVGKLSEYNAMRQRVQTFSQTLNFAASDMVSKLAMLSQGMEEKLDKLRVKVSDELRSQYNFGEVSSIPMSSDRAVAPKPVTPERPAAINTNSTIASMQSMMASLRAEGLID